MAFKVTIKSSDNIPESLALIETSNTQASLCLHELFHCSGTGLKSPLSCLQHLAQAKMCLISFTDHRGFTVSLCGLKQNKTKKKTKNQKPTYFCMVLSGTFSFGFSGSVHLCYCKVKKILY